MKKGYHKTKEENQLIAAQANEPFMKQQFAATKSFKFL